MSQLSGFNAYSHHNNFASFAKSASQPKADLSARDKSPASTNQGGGLVVDFNRVMLSHLDESVNGTNKTLFSPFSMNQPGQRFNMIG